MQLSKVQPPSTMEAGWPPALTTSWSQSSAVGVGPMPMKPFSDWSWISTPSGR